MGDNIIVAGREIPDRSTDKWKAMAVHLWKYLHPDMAEDATSHVLEDRGLTTWKEEAIKLYEQAMKGV